MPGFRVCCHEAHGKDNPSETIGSSGNSPDISGEAKHLQGKAAGIKRNAARSGRSIHRICGGKARYSFFRMTMYSLCIVFMLAPFLFEGLVTLGIRLPVIDRT